VSTHPGVEEQNMWHFRSVAEPTIWTENSSTRRLWNGAVETRLGLARKL